MHDDPPFRRLENSGLLVINDVAQAANTTLVVVGVARGGTSLLAGILSKLGVFMGDESHPPVYEDLCLSRAFENGDPGRPNDVIADYDRRYTTWGWKRPGSVDYLERMHGLLRKPRYLVVFKDIFSIANRNRISMANDVLPGMQRALSDYQKVIDFLEQRKPPALLVSYDKALSDKAAFVDAMIDFCGLHPEARARDSALSFVTPNPKAYMEGTRADRVVGRLDVVTPHEVSGWAALATAESPNPLPLEVKLSINNTHTFATKADIFRTDLKDAGVHPTGKAAYRFDLSTNDRLKAGDRVRVFAGGQRTELDNSPQTLSAPTRNPAAIHQPPPHPLVFLHIPKTAGTSLRILLRRQLTANGLVTLDPPLPPGHKRAIAEQLPQMQALLGHLYFGIDEQLGFHARYATFLRDPVARVVSFWKHQQTHPHSKFHAQAKAGTSLRAFVASAATIQTNNHMTRILVGTSAPGLLDDSKSCVNDERYLEMALNNVRRRFCFIGFMEHFDDSVRALFAAMGWPAAKKPPGRHNTLRSDASTLDDETLQTIQQHNALDLALYERLAKTSPWLKKPCNLIGATSSGPRGEQ